MSSDLFTATLAGIVLGDEELYVFRGSKEVDDSSLLEVEKEQRSTLSVFATTIRE